MSILETCETFRLGILAETGKAPIAVTLFSETFDRLVQEIPEPEAWVPPLPFPPAPEPGAPLKGVHLNGTIYLRGL